MASEQSLVVRHLETIDRVAESISRRYGMEPDDADDFRGELLLHLSKDDCRVLRSYTGDAPIVAYLAAVAANLWKDFTIRRYGKWRPSARARRLGPTAIALERMIGYEGLSLDEAVEHLIARGTDMSRRELVELAASLPVNRRRQIVQLVAVDSVASGDQAETDLQRGEMERTAERVKAVVKSTLESWPVEDRVVFRMHHVDGRPISVISRVLGLPQKPLYRRNERLVEVVRRALQESEIEPDEALELVGQGIVDWHEH